MKSKILALITLAVAFSSCSYESHWVRRPPMDDQAPQESSQPKTVAEVINAMQYRTEGSCANRDLALHYLESPGKRVGNYISDELRMALYGDHTADVSDYSASMFLDGYASSSSNIQTTWHADGSEVRIENIGTVHVSVINGVIKASLAVEQKSDLFKHRGETLELSKQVGIPTSNFIKMDCLPSLRRNEAGYSRTTWSIAKNASPILNRPSLNDIIPVNYQSLLSLGEGSCERGARKLVTWRAESGNTKIKLRFQQTGIVQLSMQVGNGYMSPRPLQWTILGGNVTIGFFKEGGPLVPEEVRAVLSLHKDGFVAEFGDEMGDLSRKRIILQPHAEDECIWVPRL